MKTKNPSNRRTMNLDEVATLLGIGRSLIYDLARRDALPVPVLKLGRRLVVPRSSVERLLGADETRSDSPQQSEHITG